MAELKPKQSQRITSAYKFCALKKALFLPTLPQIDGGERWKANAWLAKTWFDSLFYFIGNS